MDLHYCHACLKRVADNCHREQVSLKGWHREFLTSYSLCDDCHSAKGIVIAYNHISSNPSGFTHECLVWSCPWAVKASMVFETNMLSQVLLTRGWVCCCKQASSCCSSLNGKALLCLCKSCAVQGIWTLGMLFSPLLHGTTLPSGDWTHTRLQHSIWWKQD